MTAGTGSESTDFVVNQLIFWLSLGLSLAGATGIGLQVARYLKKKMSEGLDRQLKAIQEQAGEREEQITRYMDKVVTAAQTRWDKHDYVIEDFNRRLTALEQQVSMQLQIVLQNQKDLRDTFMQFKKDNGLSTKQS